jgi:hypothetical protein
VSLLESDWSRIEEHIDAAELAIEGRLREFSLNHGGTPEENQAILDAVNKLSTLRLEVRSWQTSKRAS